MGLALVLAGLGVGLVAFAVTAAPPWNEGLHLVAAQLIREGKHPYVDFFYQHPPVYAYLLAAWMRLLGDSWRSAGAAAGLFTAGAVGMVAGYVGSRAPSSGWGRAVAAAAALLVGLHTLVTRFGTVAQAFGFCLFLLVVAYRLTVAAADHPGRRRAAAAGLCAGAAAASWLLAAPALAVLPLWIARHNRTGSWPGKCAAFLAGALCGFLPLLWLVGQAPRAVLFDVFAYHLLHRRPEGAPGYYWQHDWRVLAGVLDSPQALVLILLAALGWLLPDGRSEWAAGRREDSVLCLWLVAALGAPAAAASPTFSGYFVLVVPFAGILASRGLHAVGSALSGRQRAAWLLLILGLYTAGAAKWWYQHRTMFQFGWRHYEDVARVVNRVTPEGAEIYALPEVYFTARRRPPPGLENPYSSYLPPGVAASRAVVGAAQIDRRLAAGRFATVVIASGPRVESLGLPRLYRQHEIQHGFELFWDRVELQP